MNLQLSGHIEYFGKLYYTRINIKIPQMLTVSNTGKCYLGIHAIADIDQGERLAHQELFRFKSWSYHNQSKKKLLSNYSIGIIYRQWLFRFIWTFVFLIYKSSFIGGFTVSLWNWLGDKHLIIVPKYTSLDISKESISVKWKHGSFDLIRKKKKFPKLKLQKSPRRMHLPNFFIFYLFI